MDWHSWIAQKTPHTAIQRGGPTVWPKGADRLIGDALGPVLHIHDEASEIFFVVSGRLRLEVGSSEEYFESGEFVLVPPLVPHNVWNGGDDDLVLFWLVAPNLVDNKWRTDDFPPGSMQATAIRGKVNGSADLPSDANIDSGLVHVAASEKRSEQTGSGQEMILYVIEGVGQVEIAGEQSAVSDDSILYVPASSAYTVSAETPLKYVAFRTPAR